MVKLEDFQIQESAPSVFATLPYEAMSAKYRFVPTITVVNALRNEGFFPVKAIQSGVRIEGKKNFTKHLLRFRRECDLNPTLQQQEFPEIVLVNSHDGTSAYQLMMGIFRLVCANGLVVGDTFSKVRAIHSGDKDIVRHVIDASYKIIEDSPAIMDAVSRWKSIPLTPEEQYEYAVASLDYNPSSLEILPKDLLYARRYADKESTLWNTYNIVQENYIKGGITGQNLKGEYRHTRAIKSIQESVSLNRNLWVLAESVAKLH